MTNKWAAFWVFLCLNLLAAYAPAVIYVPGLPGATSTGWKVLFSPVLLLLIMVWATNSVVAWFMLIGFVVGVGLTSALLFWSKWAYLAVPGILFVYSMSQGLLAAQIISGINAIGHS